jgi:hypothetical protein
LTPRSQRSPIADHDAVARKPSRSATKLLGLNAPIRGTLGAIVLAAFARRPYNGSFTTAIDASS